jgi:hypothetical protein
LEGKKAAADGNKGRAMRKQLRHSNKRRKRTRAEEKIRRRENAVSAPDGFEDEESMQRRDEEAFMMEAFYSIKDTIIPIVENEIPMLVSSLEECDGDVLSWTWDALYAAADVIDDAGLTPAAISAIAEGSSEAALPFLHRAIEDQLPRLRAKEQRRGEARV